MECKICKSKNNLKSISVSYCDKETNIKLCEECNKILNTYEFSSYGFVLQIFLLNLGGVDFKVPLGITSVYEGLAKKISILKEKRCKNELTSVLGIDSGLVCPSCKRKVSLLLVTPEKILSFFPFSKVCADCDSKLRAEFSWKIENHL